MFLLIIFKKVISYELNKMKTYFKNKGTMLKKFIKIKQLCGQKLVYYHLCKKYTDKKIRSQIEKLCSKLMNKMSI